MSESVKVRRLRGDGTAELREIILAIKHDRSAEVPANRIQEILFGTDTSEELIGGGEVEPRAFESKGEWALYISERVGALSEIARYDDGLWNWLTLFYLDSVIPVSNGTRREPLKLYSYLLSVDSERWSFYRHLLAAPYWFISDYPEDAGGLLCGTLDSWPDGHESLTGAAERYAAPAVVSIYNALYHDSASSNGWKIRAADNSDRYPGTIRRFVDLWLHLKVTHDIPTMTPEEYLALLPPEFDVWKTGTPTRAQLIAAGS